MVRDKNKLCDLIKAIRMIKILHKFIFITLLCLVYIPFAFAQEKTNSYRRQTILFFTALAYKNR